MMTVNLGTAASSDRRHHLGTIACDAFVFVLAPNHEAGDVLQEHQGNSALAAQLDEMRALLSAFH
jgi:hypothetical protein